MTRNQRAHHRPVVSWHRAIAEGYDDRDRKDPSGIGILELETCNKVMVERAGKRGEIEGNVFATADMNRQIPESKEKSNQGAGRDVPRPPTLKSLA